MKINVAIAALAALAQVGNAENSVGLTSTSTISKNGKEVLSLSKDSACSLNTNSLPWKVQCNTGLVIGFDVAKFNGTVTFGSNVQLLIDFDNTGNSTEVTTELGFQLSTPAVKIQGKSVIDLGLTVDGKTVPEDRLFTIPIETKALQEGLCVSGKIGASGSADAAVKGQMTAALAANAKAGGDICIKAPVFKIDPETKTGEIQVVVTVTAFSQAKAGANVVGALSSALGGDASAGLSWVMNLGAMVNAETSSSRRRLEQTDKDGTIYLDNTGNSPSGAASNALFSTLSVLALFAAMRE